VKLSRQRDHWDRLAFRDPFWAILTDPAKRGGGWDIREFFETGVREIAAAMQIAKNLGYPVGHGTALDFGCGVGRLTHALSGYFDHVTGVDLSPAMIDLAKHLNRVGGRCVYIPNLQNHLRQFNDETFDFVYSCIVLQHIHARNARRFVREFVRVLRPSGLALFQLPSHLSSASVLSRLGYRFNRLRRQVLREPEFMYMGGVPRKTVVLDVEKSGGRIIDVLKDESAGPEWVSYIYGITK
jgi:SAM-dependent methyltransferase